MAQEISKRNSEVNARPTSVNVSIADQEIPLDKSTCCTKAITDASLAEILQIKLDHFVEGMQVEENVGLFPLVISIVEKSLIENILAKTKGNQLKSSEILGINRNTLRKKIQELNLDVKKIKKKSSF